MAVKVTVDEPDEGMVVLLASSCKDAATGVVEPPELLLPEPLPAVPGAPLPPPQPATISAAIKANRPDWNPLERFDLACWNNFIPLLSRGGDPVAQPGCIRAEHAARTLVHSRNYKQH